MKNLLIYLTILAASCAPEIAIDPKVSITIKRFVPMELDATGQMMQECQLQCPTNGVESLACYKPGAEEPYLVVRVYRADGTCGCDPELFNCNQEEEK